MFGSSKFTQILIGAASLLAIASAAHAADPVLPETPASGFNWSGFYVGVGGGVGAVNHEVGTGFTDDVSLNGVGGDGVFGEVTVGYDHVFGNRFLLGAFVDGTYGNIGPDFDFSTFGPDFDASIENTYGFDAVARLGYLVTPNTLGYVLGGYSWQKFELDSSIPGGDTDWDRSGYVLGVGMETVLTGNWTLKGEYRYANYGTQGFLPVFGTDALELDSTTHTFHVGVNYRFGAQNGAAAAFETTAYNFTGFSIGLAGGAGQVIQDLGLDFSPFPVGAELDGLSGEGVFGQLSVGYDHEFSNGWVAGVLVDGTYSGIETTLDLGPFGAKVEADYGFDVLGRVGKKLTDSTMAYALAGYSWQHFNVDASAFGNSDSVYDWGANGFSVGGGIEAGLSEHLAVNLEYRYSQFQDEDFGSDGVFQTEPSFHTVRLGAKYKFN